MSTSGGEHSFVRGSRDRSREESVRLSLRLGGVESLPKGRHDLERMRGRKQSWQVEDGVERLANDDISQSDQLNVDSTGTRFNAR